MKEPCIVNLNFGQGRCVLLYMQFLRKASQKPSMSENTNRQMIYKSLVYLLSPAVAIYCWECGTTDRRTTFGPFMTEIYFVISAGNFQNQE